MSTKTQQYAHQSLAACGFAVMSSVIAWKQRPDLWASAQDCGMDFTAKLTIPDTQRLSAKLAGLDSQVLVLTRSADDLSKRIEWVTGYKVESMGAGVGVVNETPAPPLITEQQRQATAGRERLEKLAAMELPAHDCQLRREILAARAAVNAQGKTYPMTQ